MRAAPPAVDIELGSGRRERAALALLQGVAGAVIATWLGLLHDGSPASSGLFGGVVGAALGAQALRPQRGRLCWDGAGWSLQTPGALMALRSVRLQIDLGGWMLLRLQTAGSAVERPRVSWCGLARRDAGAAWHGLRLALYQGPMDAADLTLDDGATR